MPKLETASLTIKISLAQITDSGNIREVEKYGPNEKGEFPPETIELAQSIKTVGQLQPINVKQTGEIDGVKCYELCAGFRRRAAFQYLVSIGEDYNQIEAKLVTGDKLTIQLVENIQRENLTAPEREAAIFQLAESGMKQNEIASRLSKNKSFVSINISAHKIRQAGIKAGIDLSGVETSTLAEFLSVPEKDLVDILNKLVHFGKTRAAAATLAAPYKKGKEMPPEPIAPPVENEPPPDVNPPMGSKPKEKEPESPEPPAGKAKIKPPGAPFEPIEADHRVIDVNIILTVIYEYIKTTEKQIAPGETDAEKNKFGALTKIEAAKDILAFIHKRLDDA